METALATQQIPAQLVFKRYELKYLLDVKQRAKLDAVMRPHMAADAWGQSTISNVYFDTPSNVLIRRSIEGGPYKEKLRVRAYGDVAPDSPAYVEVKEKLDGVVYKRRIGSTASRALASLSSDGFPGEDQVSREIDYFVRRYRGIAPAFFVASDRCAYYAADDPDFRITLDTDIRWRDSRLALTCVLSRGSEQNGHRNLSRMVTRPERRYRAFPCMRACLTRYDSPRNCRSLPWCTTRSITAAAIWSSPKTEPHLENSRLVVNTTDCLS